MNPVTRVVFLQCLCAVLCTRVLNPLQNEETQSNLYDTKVLEAMEKTMTSHFFEDNAGPPLIFTKYIEDNKISEVRNLSAVTGILPNNTNITSYAGFFTVNKTCNSNIFVWLVLSENSPTDDPLTIWIPGGPGVPVLLSALQLLGTSLNAKLELQRESERRWTRNSSLLFIDNPVNSGFSFTSNDSCMSTNKFEIGSNLIKVVEQFYMVFPELQLNDVYIAGSSYAGQVIPPFAHLMHNSKFHRNLKGVIIGSGLVDPWNQFRVTEFAYQGGLIDAKSKQFIAAIEKNITHSLMNNSTLAARRGYLNVTDQLSRSSGFYLLNNLLYAGFEQIYFPYIIDWLSQPTIRRALHTGNTTWDFNTTSYLHLFEDMAKSTLPLIGNLVENYKVLIITGQLDIRFPYPNAENMLKEMQWSGRSRYLNAERKIWRLDGHVAGYVKSVDNLMDICIRNAGHSLTKDQPEVLLNLYNHFIKNQSVV